MLADVTQLTKDHLLMELFVLCLLEGKGFKSV